MSAYEDKPFYHSSIMSKTSAHTIDSYCGRNDPVPIGWKAMKGNTVEKKSNSKEHSNLVNDAASPLNCSVCQTPCVKCKSLCVTCKLPCEKCATEKCHKNSSTDTDDFDKYLESQFKKLKNQPKVKTVGVDTCDLESHFDFYKLERETIRIQKSVATDCTDLNLRSLVMKKMCKNTIGTDTSDLFVHSPEADRSQCSDGNKSFWTSNDCKIQWIDNNMEETSGSKKNTQSEDPLLTLNDDGDDGDGCSVSLLDGNFPEKENTITDINSREVTFDTSSDESDVDLITSCKLSKSKELVRKHKITLRELNSRNSTSFQCTICKKMFEKKHLAVLHLASHIENDKLKCLICGKQFVSIEILFAHIQSGHATHAEDGHCFGISDTTNKNKWNDDGNKCKIGKVYQCALCPNESNATQFDSYKALYLHKKLKHGLGKTREGKTGKRVRVKQEFICLICGKQFKSSKALKDHSPVHTGEKNYPCDICNKSYTTSANLKIHKRTHTGARNFVCSVCNKAFHKKDSLKVHFRKHSGERPFQCDLCPMRFDRNYILKNHRYTHFSEKKFICPFCGKTFTTHGGLNNHEKSHKKDPFAKKPRKPAVKPTLETENAVICDVCGKIYSTKSNLRIHKFVHLGIKPFECNVCHQSYAKKDSMLTHMRKHFDERPFTCETCGMKFYRNHTLKTHLLRHTGERPHKCKICGKTFTQSSSLAYHVKNHDRKVDKKKTALSDTAKLKKKKVISSGTKSTPSPVKKPSNILKSALDDFGAVSAAKPLFEEKKPEEDDAPDLTLLKNALPITLPEKMAEKTANFLFPVPDKEILILDKHSSGEISKNLNANKEIDFLQVDKDSIPHASTVGKFNYYIAKSHVFSFPKEMMKEKTDTSGQGDLNLPKGSYIVKEEPLIAVNRYPNLKGLEPKEEHVFDVKTQPATPITGEILNAAFISDENGEVIPFGSMTLHSLNPDNVMISPVITLEEDERKGFVRSSKLTVLDSKIGYNSSETRMVNEKGGSIKGGCQVISLKDARIPQKIHIELNSGPLQIQAAVDESSLQEIPGFYTGVQQNEL